MKRRRWLNRTVLGIGTASFLSDVSHETATSLLPLLVGELGNPAALLGAIEGLSDAASGGAKLWAGWASDRQSRRKPMAVIGYAISAIAGATLGAATRPWHAVVSRTTAWVGRGVRTPARGALLAGDVDPAHYGKAYGFERALDTLGAVVGPMSAALLVGLLPFRTLMWATLAPGLMAACAMAFLVRERPREAVSRAPFLAALTGLRSPYRRYLVAVGVFGAGDFAHSMLILYATAVLTPGLGTAAAAGTAIMLYGLHNAAGAILAFVFGAAGDRFGRRRALRLAYLCGAGMVTLLLVPPPGRPAADTLLLAAAFILAGAMRAGESALESAIAAELLAESERGTGFGALAAVNSLGDLVSSLLVGLVWSVAGPQAAFCAALLPMLAGAWLLKRGSVA